MENTQMGHQQKFLKVYVNLFINIKSTNINEKKKNDLLEIILIFRKNS